MSGYGSLTPEALRALMDSRGIESYRELEKMTGIGHGHISNHMRGIRPLGMRSRQRLARLFVRVRERNILFNLDQGLENETP